jgi:4-amino-4-deoxy-L-arabinose transferase-like glycosyltransferase
MMPTAPNADGLDSRPAPKRLLLGLFVLTLVVRGGALVLIPGALADDPDGYRRLAENLLEHRTFGDGRAPTAYRPPLYPLVLTACVALGKFSRLAIGILHLGMGLATVWLVFHLGRRWGLGHYPAALAAALVACDPILLAQSAQVMTETPATLLAVVALISLTAAGEQPSAGRAAVAGGCLALAGLCRPGLLIWTVAAGVILAALSRSWPMRLKVLGGFTVAAVLVVSPWAIRNCVRFGRPVVSTTHGGYTLLLGNNPFFYEYLRSGAWGTVWDADELDSSRTIPGDELDDELEAELEADRRAYAEAWANIRREPEMFFCSCLVRTGRLWSPLPHQLDEEEGMLRRLARYTVGLWYLAELSLAAVGLWVLFRRGRRGWLWGLLLAGCLTAVHTVYWSNMRMRAPLIPVVALAAAAAICRMPSGRRARSGR